jgi:hypothetical protein
VAGGQAPARPASAGGGHALVVGDVHGCLDELTRLLRAANFGAGDELVFVGDLVAKGPDSQGVVQLARERGALAVLGNHEARLLQARDEGLGGAIGAVAATMTPADWAYIEALPLTRSLAGLAARIVHGGLVPGVPLEAQERRWLLNLRSIDARGQPSKRATEGVPWASTWAGPDLVVFGHDALRGLQRNPHAFGLDTGCVYGFALTGLWLPERSLVQVPALRAWQSID